MSLPEAHAVRVELPDFTPGIGRKADQCPAYTLRKKTGRRPPGCPHAAMWTPPSRTCTCSSTERPTMTVAITVTGFDLAFRACQPLWRSVFCLNPLRKVLPSSLLFSYSQITSFRSNTSRCPGGTFSAALSDRRGWGCSLDAGHCLTKTWVYTETHAEIFLASGRWKLSSFCSSYNCSVNNY